MLPPPDPKDFKRGCGRHGQKMAPLVSSSHSLKRKKVDEEDRLKRISSAWKVSSDVIVPPGSDTFN